MVVYKINLMGTSITAYRRADTKYVETAAIRFCSSTHKNENRFLSRTGSTRKRYCHRGCKDCFEDV